MAMPIPILNPVNVVNIDGICKSVKSGELK